MVLFFYFIILSKGHYYFLVSAQESNQRKRPKGRFEQMPKLLSDCHRQSTISDSRALQHPLGIPRRTEPDCRTKIGTFLFGTGARLRCSRGYGDAGREILKRAALIAGAINSASLKSASLGHLSCRNKKGAIMISIKNPALKQCWIFYYVISTSPWSRISFS